MKRPVRFFVAACSGYAFALASLASTSEVRRDVPNSAAQFVPALK